MRMGLKGTKMRNRKLREISDKIKKSKDQIK
jgi:hypothetical protein